MEIIVVILVMDVLEVVLDALGVVEHVRVHVLVVLINVLDVLEIVMDALGVLLNVP